MRLVCHSSHGRESIINVAHFSGAVQTYCQFGDMGLSLMYEMITLCQLRSVDLNHTSRGKPFQRRLFKCFHCEALRLYPDGSESGLALKQSLLADNHLTLTT